MKRGGIMRKPLNILIIISLILLLFSCSTVKKADIEESVVLSGQQEEKAPSAEGTESKTEPVITEKEDETVPAITPDTDEKADTGTESDVPGEKSEVKEIIPETEESGSEITPSGDNSSVAQDITEEDWDGQRAVTAPDNTAAEAETSEDDNSDTAVSTAREEASEAVTDEAFSEKAAVEDEAYTPIEKGDSDDVTTLFSYAFGVKNMNELVESGIPFITSYFMRGLYDASLDWNSPVFVTLGNLQSVINEFYGEYISGDVHLDNGPRPGSIEELLELEYPEREGELFSYAYGFSVIRDLLSSEIDIEIIPFMAGMLDERYSETAPLSDEEIQDALNSYIYFLNEEYYTELEEKAEENLKKAQEFLEANSREDGITVLDNGVQILLLASDDVTGDKPTQYDTVIMDYNEYILDYETGELEFTDADWNAEVSVITLEKGLQSAVTNMHVGEAIRAFIPPEYSGISEGDGADIEPNSLFVYDIALQHIL